MTNDYPSYIINNRLIGNINYVIKLAKFIFHKREDVYSIYTSIAGWFHTLYFKYEKTLKQDPFRYFTSYIIL